MLLEVRAGGVAEAVAAALVLLLEDLLHFLRILAGDAQLLAHALVEILGERFGRFDRKAVEVQVVAVVVRLEQFLGELARALAHGDQREGDGVVFAALHRPVEIGYAKAAVVRLARELEADRFAHGCAIFEVRPDKQVVLVGLAGEVAVDRLGYEQVFGDCPLLHAAEYGAHFVLHEGGVLGAAAFALLVLPLAAKEGGFVDPRVDLAKRDAAHHPAAPERRLRDWHVAAHARHGVLLVIRGGAVAADRWGGDAHLVVATVASAA